MKTPVKTPAIEKGFPFEEIDKIAEAESYRKEIYRPIYHIHKWWANRLGSVFRAILISLQETDTKNVMSQFYSSTHENRLRILDPFMGSGTTLGEGLKLGMDVIGSDINPVSFFTVKQALTNVRREDLLKEFKKIENDVSSEILNCYRIERDGYDEPLTVLYYFWVKVVETPEGMIPLFKNYIFSKNTYPKKKPKAQILCKDCLEVFEGKYNDTSVDCPNCGLSFNPQIGTTERQYVIGKSGERYKIKDLVQKKNTPPDHKMYALMAITKEGKKVYLSVDENDQKRYESFCRKIKNHDLPLPDLEISSGYNTNQVKGYNYHNWKDFFNDRQLYCLGLLFERILKIEDKTVKEHFIALFSSCLEFNNMFCSFKGEGTGAVRHMFSHHILKPERMPLENNVWGTSKSSGAFSTLFRSRLLRAKEYLDSPFEIAIKGGKSEKVYLEQQIKSKIANDFEELTSGESNALLFNTDSANLKLPAESIDAVVTDPPYFDFVHYSELSDFFFAWLKVAFSENYAEDYAEDYAGFSLPTCRQEGEVQDREPSAFATSLGNVFKEAHRVLKKGGHLVFSFHHSRAEGWEAIFTALNSASFTLVRSYPVKAEMSVGSPKSAAKDPINLDILLVCKKICKKIEANKSSESFDPMFDPVKSYRNFVKRFELANRTLSNNDRKVIMYSQFLVWASINEINSSDVSTSLKEIEQTQAESIIKKFCLSHYQGV